MTGTLITSQFNAESTALEVVRGIDLHGRQAIVTGGASGLGLEIARALAAAGATVTIADVDAVKGVQTVALLNAEAGRAAVAFAELELASLAAVRAFAAGYRQQNDKLDLLINNAGVMACPLLRTKEGHEFQFGVNYLGHWLLADELLPLLERYKPASFWEFLKVLRLDWAVLAVFWQLFRIADIRNYIFKNLLFEVPWLRRRLFLADARKIVPDMGLEDLSFAEGYGGVRPQLIDKANRKLMLGEASIAARPGLVFNVTPSPGGTCCLGNAARDLEAIVERLGCGFDRQRLARELYGEAG